MTEPQTEAEASGGLVRGVCSALLIELVLVSGVLLGMLIVAWWPRAW